MEVNKEQDLQMLIKVMNQVSKEYGIIINVNMTRIMRISRIVGGSLKMCGDKNELNRSVNLPDSMA